MHVKSKQPDISYRLKENSWMARLAAWKLNAGSVAFVLGNTIHLYKVSKQDFLNNETWLRHELCHVRQFRQHGFLPFIFKYVWESVKHGYYNNKYESEARLAEKDVRDFD
jgi:hypothetical protein